MKTIGVMANCGKPRARDVVTALASAAARYGMKTLADPDTAALVPGLEGLPLPALFDRVDCVVAVGGDGTMLKAARELDGRDVPLMGVNIGSLGFLTTVSEHDAEVALRCLAEDRCIASGRTVLAVAVERAGTECAVYRGLNDAVVTSGASSRMVTLDVEVNGALVTSYVCDGLIVSTPTGSTGHAMSAGGPIVMPDARVFVISLICPHTLSSRPLVVPDDADITVREASGSKARMNLSVDGQVGQVLASGDVLRVRRAPETVRVMLLPDYSHFAVLRQKLNWRGSSGR